MNKELLTRPFPAEAIKSRPGQNGRTLHYVDVAAFIQRLNESTDGWDFTIEKYEVLDGEVVVLGKLVIENSVVKSAFGGSSVTIDKSGEVVSIADDLKAAASDALKKAASLLGVGLELYGGQAQAQPPARPGPSQESRVTSRQLAALHSSARKRGLSRDALADVVHERTGVAELAALTKAQASELISELSGSNGGGR